MKKILTAIVFLPIAISVIAETPQREISALIEKYPSAQRKVWYYFDKNAEREYLRLQLFPKRQTLSSSDIERLTTSFQELWENTDFSKETGVQYKGPDTLSLTINGRCAAAFDLGPNTVSADYAFNTRSKSRGDRPNFNHLLQTYSKIKNGHKTKSHQVKYSGFKPGVEFIFQRGNGAGWTQGTRTTIYNATTSDYRQLRGAMRSFIGSKVPVTVFDYTWTVLVKSESTPDFFAIDYNPTTKQLHFLQANVENQICVPLDWQKIDYLTNSEIKYNK